MASISSRTVLAAVVGSLMISPPPVVLAGECLGVGAEPTADRAERLPSGVQPVVGGGQDLGGLEQLRGGQLRRARRCRQRRRETSSVVHLSHDRPP
jgi:hypothetical protein